MSESGIWVDQFEVGPMENFVYFVGDRKTREVLVVDPAWEADTILERARKNDLKIVGALISHYHFDHTNAIEPLLEARDIPVYVNKKDIPYMAVSHTSLVGVDSEAQIPCGTITVKAVHTPGHTPGSQCFWVENNLLSGDTLFINACGRCDLPGGSAEEMYYSLTQRLAKFPDSTVLFPGHNYSDRMRSTLGDERKYNPYLLCDSLKNFLRFRVA